MMNAKTYRFAFFLCVSLQSCQERYLLTYKPAQAILVVDGGVTDLAGPQYIQLNRYQLLRSDVYFEYVKNNIKITPVSKAQVSVVENGQHRILLTETKPGTYRFSLDFRGKVGHSYQLKFQTAEGTSYASTTETMIAASSIEKVYDVFDPKLILDPVVKKEWPTSNIYLDFQDTPNQRNYYMWRWKLYESQTWCASCERGYYVLKDLGTHTEGSCESHPELIPYDTYLDYPCRDLTWDIFYSFKLNIFADDYTNGKPQKGRLVAQMPVYQSNPCLVDIQQYSLTAGAYRYYKTVIDNVQNSGTLNDTPPAPTIGNVSNLSNKDEKVMGYFSASSVTVQHYWLDRKNTTGGVFNGLFGLLTKRIPNLEIKGAYRVPPALDGGLPSALCEESKYRTCTKPIGWP